VKLLFKKKSNKKKVAAKEKKDKKLKGSEWVVLGILFVGISEIIVNKYSLSWRFLPYTFAILAVLAGKLLLALLKIFTKACNYFLYGIKNI
jgi:hypothetical protein